MFLSFKGADIYYEISGEGIPLVFLHGFPFRSEMWVPQNEYLSERGFKVITLDLRGHGKSTGVPESISEMGEDVIALIEELQLEKPVIVGMSMGGYVAYDISVNNPELFSAGIYVSTKADGDSEAVKKARNELIDNIKNKGPAAVADFYMEKLFSPVTFEKNGDLVKQVENWISDNRVETLIGATKAMRDRKDNREKLGNITFPVLILTGEDDPMVPKDAVKEHYNKIKNSEYKMVKNAGHMVNLEESDTANKIIEEFLKKL